MSTQYKKEESVEEIILFCGGWSKSFFFKVKKGLCFFNSFFNKYFEKIMLIFFIIILKYLPQQRIY